MSKAAGWTAGAGVLLGLSALALRYYVPPLPGTLDLTIAFAATPAGASEPLAVTGQPGDGDFIFVRHLDARTVAFGYDRWGAGGPVSRPIAVQPGVRYPLRLESPSLANVRGSAVAGPARLRVIFDGAVVFDAAVPFHLREAKHAWFGENPLGGSACGARFAGEVWRADGRPLRGRARAVLSAGDRLAGWWWFGRWQVLGILLASTACGWGVAWLVRTRGAPMRDFLARHRAGPHRWFVSAAGLCVVAFSWLVTGGTGEFTFPETFGTFYDYQAASLLQGRLDVPEPAISGEAFVVDGRHYGYFGLTPALLRLPFVIYGIAFGSLSRWFLLFDYAACLIAAYALLCRATRRVHGASVRPSAAATVAFTLCAGLGSTLFFLGARAYIYHEAILCGAAFGLWGAYAALRWLEAPATRWWLGSLACGVLAVHARPSTGLFALALLGAAAVAVALEGRRFRRALGIITLAAAGIASFGGLSHLKFGTFDGSPFRYGVQYDAARRARFGDRNFHLANVPFNFDAYVRRPNFVCQRGFPWLLLNRQGREGYPRARMDLIEDTLGFPYAMPALFVLATLGSVAAARRVPALRRDLVVLWLGILPMTAALFSAIVVSHRFTGDFVPFLLGASACGLVALEAETGRRRTLLRVGLAVLVALSLAITAAVTLRFQGELVWGVPEHVNQNYERLRTRIDAFFGIAPP